MALSRAERRTAFDQPTRLRLVEDDGDQFEQAIADVRGLLTKLLWAVVTLAVSTTATCITILATAR